ncbi:FUSC family protein [Rubellimicrobium arenae]|uniref:FUSC family protein n=1 Tax=Rubellimicrobium arenae TaxID=2817372 RepID=UPI001B311C81|nr:FUSC family protein [Rubellimicrobium arenae]
MLEGLRAIHRDAWRDAMRLGLQSAVAAAAAYGIARWVGDVDPFLVIMMAVTSLQRSVGGTMGQAVIRLQSALAGSLLGLACLVLLPSGWGTAVALAVSLFAVGVASALRPLWQLAVVPAVGMSLAGHEDLVDTALVSSAGILMGAALGVVVALAVWPERAESRFERQFRRALRATATRLTDAVEATVEPGRTPRVDEHLSAWHEAVWLAQEALSEARFVDRAGMQARLDALRELHDSVTILDRAAEAESPPLAVEGMRGQVMHLRRDACEVLTGMARGEDAGAGQIDDIDATLERLRAAMEAEAVGGAERETRSALAFGLREVRRTLAALIEAQGALRA